jgi:hypothetical protein
MGHERPHRKQYEGSVVAVYGTLLELVFAQKGIQGGLPHTRAGS